MPEAKATLYTHTLNYTRIDGTSEQLTGTITFDDSQVPSNTVNSSFNSNFITNITITYTNDVGTGGQQIILILLMVVASITIHLLLNLELLLTSVLLQVIACLIN